MSLKRILLVEDSEPDVELTLEALAEHKLANEVDVARDGVEALDYVYRRGRFDGRPDGNPVVMLTSSREERDLVESYSLGVNAYVVKPVDFAQFVDAVKEVGVFWAVVNQPPPGSLGARQ